VFSFFLFFSFFPFHSLGRFIPNRDRRRLSNGSGAAARRDVKDRRKPRWVARNGGGPQGTGRRGGQTDERTDVRTDVRTGGRKDGRMDRRRRGFRDRDVPGLPSAEPPSVNVWRFLEGQLNI
jgi:hypothetical protein